MVKEQNYSSADGFHKRKHGKKRGTQAETIPVLETQPRKFNRDRPGNMSFRKNVIPDAHASSRDGSNVALQMKPPHKLFPANPDQYRRKPVQSLFQRLPPQNNLKNKSDGLFDLQVPDFDGLNDAPSVVFPNRPPPIFYSGQETHTAMMAQHAPNECTGSTVLSAPQSAEDLMLKRLLALISAPEKTTPMDNPPMLNTLFRQNPPTQQVTTSAMASTHSALNRQSMMASQNPSSVPQFIKNFEMPETNKMDSNLQFDPKTAENILFYKKLMALKATSTEKSTPREEPQISMIKSLFEPKPLMEMILETQQLTTASMVSTENVRHRAPTEKTTPMEDPQMLMIRSLLEPKPLMEMISETQQVTTSSMGCTENSLNETIAASQNTSNVSQFNQNLMQVDTDTNNVVPEEQAKQEKMDKLLLMLTLLKRNENSEIVEMAGSQEYGPMDGNSVEPTCNLYEDNSQECDQSSSGNVCTDVGDPQVDQVPYTRISLPSSAAKSGKERFKDDLKAGSKKQSQKKNSDQGMQSLNPKRELRQSGVPQEKLGRVDRYFVSPGSKERSKELRKTNRPQEKTSSHGKMGSRPFDPEKEQREGGMHHEKRGKVDRDFVSAPFGERREELRKTNQPQERTTYQGIWSSRPSDYSEQEQREVGMRYEERGRVDRDLVSVFSAERQDNHKKTNRQQERTSDQGIWSSRPSDYSEQEQREVGMRHERRGRVDRDFVSAPYAERQEDHRKTNRQQERTFDQGIWSSRPSDYSEQEQRDVGMHHEKGGRVDRPFVSGPSAERHEELRKTNRPQESTSDHGIWSSRPSDYSELEQREVGMYHENRGRLDRGFVPASSADRREELRKTNRPPERAPDRGLGISSLFNEPEWEQRESGVRHEKHGRLDRDFVSTPSTERREKLRNTNRSQERISDHGIWNSSPSDDPEWAQSESNMRYEKRGGLDRDFVSTPSTERWEEFGRERNFDHSKWSSRPSDNIEWEQRERDLSYEKSARLDREYLAPPSTEGREAFKSIKQTRKRTIQSSRPYEDPEWAQRESGPHYEKSDRPNKKIVSPRSTGRPINQSQERAYDQGIWSSRPFDDHEWAERESDVCHEKHARLDRGFISPRTTEGRKKNPTDPLANLPIDVLKRIRGKDSFTASAILSEYAERKSFK